MQTPTLRWLMLCRLFSSNKKICFSIKKSLWNPPLKCQVWSGGPAFVSERVKGFRSAVAGSGGWASSVLPFCPEVLGVRGLQGKALWCHRAAVAGLPRCSPSLPTHNPFHSHQSLCQAEAFLLNELSCERRGSEMMESSAHPSETSLVWGSRSYLGQGPHH